MAGLNRETFTERPKCLPEAEGETGHHVDDVLAPYCSMAPTGFGIAVGTTGPGGVRLPSRNSDPVAAIRQIYRSPILTNASTCSGRDTAVIFGWSRNALAGTRLGRPIQGQFLQ